MTEVAAPSRALAAVLLAGVGAMALAGLVLLAGGGLLLALAAYSLGGAVALLLAASAHLVPARASRLWRRHLPAGYRSALARAQTASRGFPHRF